MSIPIAIHLTPVIGRSTGAEAAAGALFSHEKMDGRFFPSPGDIMGLKMIRLPLLK
jgi:hypothetical protein